MEGLGVIKKTEEPTDWVNSMVCVSSKKNDKLRVCMDPKDLNANIRRKHYQIPKREEIVSEMTGAKYFSKMDASNGFWQLKLDEESAKLCTFNTPFGRYSYQRLPFGISSAPEIFHRAMEQIVEGLEGVRVYVDDLVVWGSTQEEHDTRLEKTLQRIQQYGLKLNRDKCRFGVSEITFLGDKISAEGVQPDKTKVQAIHDMEKPKDKKGVQRALGMVNYLGRFIPNLAVKTAHLRKLLQRETEFQWGHEHETEWKGLLEVLAGEPLLMFFCPEKRTKVSTDASKDGLGAVLLQEEEGAWQPVAYASRSMTATECRYAQIEKECLGLAFGCEKFHTYIYGLPKVILETDHKPLLGIAKKNLCGMSPRIQRLMMRLQRYDFELTYVPGTQMFIADTLSRAAPCVAQTSESEEDVALHVDMVYAALPATQEQLSKIAKETSEDPVLRKVMRHLQEGWIKGSCKQYYHIQSELSVVDGLLLKGDRIVVPTSMRREMLNRIHEGHLGAEKSKRRARKALYWPNMNSDIDQLTSECATCQEYHYKQTREPLIPTELPTQPWEKANGKAEKGVQIVKRLLKKAAHSNTDPYLALMAYRAAPLESGKSPAELLMGRNIRTRLPRYVTYEHRDEVWADKARKLQQKQKTCYDRTATALVPLQEKDVVRIEGPGSWTKRATVLQQVTPRSYSVMTENGNVIRRNRRHLLKTGGRANGNPTKRGG
ncbi:hypothetical protein SKAU_G00019710 [Synaphobranchus kaupii]|uniref:Gypsy retrotransposon integrase-like protein 1 n=1 Tax=Synaphobranchus kaupii TaxID=118154 RepID=A0A9Q1JD02_SYNKA|nr:hypothetical protein SKAU_G00019710 [Synaphobranchus kaupii]